MNRTEAVRAGRAKAEVRSLRVPGIWGYRVPEFGSSVLTEFRSGRWMPGLTMFSCALLIDPRSGIPEYVPHRDVARDGQCPVLPCPAASPRRGRLPNLPHSASYLREVGK